MHMLRRARRCRLCRTALTINNASLIQYQTILLLALLTRLTNTMVRAQQQREYYGVSFQSRGLPLLPFLLWAYTCLRRGMARRASSSVIWGKPGLLATYEVTVSYPTDKRKIARPHSEYSTNRINTL